MYEMYDSTYLCANTDMCYVATLMGVANKKALPESEGLFKLFV